MILPGPALDSIFMRLIVVRCGAPEVEVPQLSVLRELVNIDSLEVLDLSAVPARQELRPLDEAALEELPVDPTPSLDEISARPDVGHLGAPDFAPQRPGRELRFVVVGSDAALSAVLTRMMRADYLWATVGYVPLHPDSAAATNWSLPANRAAAFRLACAGTVRPAPVIRNDASIVVAGSATISAVDGGTLDAEVIVDDATLIYPEKVRNTRARFYGQFGVKLVPMTDAPGIAAVRLTTPLTVAEENRGGRGLRGAIGSLMSRSLTPAQVQAWSETPGLSWLVDRAPLEPAGIDPRSLLSGRAVQAGGVDLRVTIDGVPGPRPVKRVTFYRHLRDLQIVRI
ncbi:hypothetical protein CGUA_11890 [Corynebacterium guangdongense]|nr:hypothetical protein CGUA_11890 [Corynebacterium guangdongense]